MVAYDRPGYGRSDPKPGRSVADAVGDIEAIADELGFERFAVVGGSGGAPHALACGALLENRVLRVGALVTPAPSDTADFDFLAGQADLNVKEFSAALEGRRRSSPSSQPYADELAREPEKVVEQIAAELPEVDRAILRGPSTARSWSSRSWRRSARVCAVGPTTTSLREAVGLRARGRYG